MSVNSTVINARWVIPVNDANAVLEDHSIIIEDDRIGQILPTANVCGQYLSAKTIDLPDHVVIPGFINAHTHAAMTLLRGAGEDVGLDTWLEKYIWPLEQKWADEHFVRDGTTLAIAESIRSGVTCMNDMYFFPEVVGETAQKYHMRVCVGLITIAFPTVWASSPDEYLAKGDDVRRQFSESKLVTTMLAPHAPYTVEDATLKKIRDISEQYDLNVHIHVHETAQEVENSISQCGMRPVERLQRLGLVNQRLTAVHMTQLVESEIKLIADKNANIVHCPKSNLKLASGICPVSSLLENNVNVAVGTDSAASNNSLNMLEEMRFAALLAKGSSGDATAVSGYEALRMATVNGAKSLGIDHETGSLEAGKLADITAIDMNKIFSQPLFDPVSHVVHCASREQVSDVWIGGRQVLEAGRLTQMDIEQCSEIAQRWQVNFSNTPDSQSA